MRLRRASKAAGAPKASGKARSGAAAATTAAAADEPPSMDDLLPRADISSQITGELIGMLGSANWKERKQGMDDVEAILAAAGGRIQPCVSKASRSQDFDGLFHTFSPVLLVCWRHNCLRSAVKS